jgi:hypothetical protein
LCHSALSAPLTKISIRSGSHETTAGSLVITPPRFSQSDHPPLPYHMCHSVLSSPLTKTLIRFGPH